MTSLKLGLRHEQTITVDESLTVPRVSQRYAGFADMPPVFATAFLVGFVEWTCIEALRPYLTHEQRTVGVHVDLSHSAATPVGMKVTAAVELIAVDDDAIVPTFADPLYIVSARDLEAQPAVVDCD